MRKGMANSKRRRFMLGLLGVMALFAAGCGGGGGGGSSPDKDAEDLFVDRFSVPNFSGILLDETVSLVFSERIKEKSLNHDSLRMRTGAQGGEAPRGTFIKGIFLFDPDTGTRVVIDPDQIGDRPLDKAQKRGEVKRLERQLAEPKQLIIGNWEGRVITLQTTRDVSRKLDRIEIGDYVTWHGRVAHQDAESAEWVVASIEKVDPNLVE